ncbi:hypothetical protein ACFSJY_02485 [Thalassotalea euphylliae]|uniref:hypothetical protein n=1 Tax=Thalassotalea euphylliae TaxID=1655234 RepID=UPI0036316451
MRTLTLLFLVLCAFNVHSAIINYDDIIDNSFYDTDTELVWIDFGVTNSRQYVKTVQQLETGGIYEGWRLPTLEEVMTMVGHIAYAGGQKADVEFAETDRSGIYEAQDGNSLGEDDSVWDSIFDVIGYNDTYAGGLATSSEALFQGTDGLSTLIISDWGATDFSVNDYITLWDHRNFDSSATSSYKGLSTLLVREARVSVSEPSGFALFLGALLFVIARKVRVSGS